MKIVLACLMCLVFTATESFAIDGGPNYGGGSVTVTGTYAGVLAPIPTVLDPGPPPVTLKDNSLALFTLVIPKVGLGTGTAAVFRNGLSYSGTIQASADPDTAKLSGVISTSFTPPGANYKANGQFVHAHIVANTNTSSTATARIRGQASITYTNNAADPNGDSGGPIFYRIRGFKQASA